MSTTRVRCISLWQPYASLMACGAKHLETRPRTTHVRGPVYIHASVTRLGIKALRTAPAATIEAMEKALGLTMDRWATDLPFGALIARGEIYDSAPAAAGLRDFPDQQPFGDFSHGRFVHAYQNLTPLPPIPLKGRQGFFFTTLDSTTLSGPSDRPEPAASAAGNPPSGASVGVAPEGVPSLSDTPYWHPLWKHMHHEHGLILLDDDCHQIARAVDESRAATGHACRPSRSAAE